MGFNVVIKLAGWWFAIQAIQTTYNLYTHTNEVLAWHLGGF